MAAARIMLVEDEPAWGDVLGEALRRQGYTVDVLPDGASAREAYGRLHPDLVVMDLVLPDGDGLVLTADLKTIRDVPVLICSATKRRRDIVIGFSLGADDFVPKPCDLDEFVTRVERLLKRPAPAPTARPTGGPWQVGTMLVDSNGRQVRVGGVPFAVTPAELRFLEAVASRPREVVPREELIQSVYGRRGRGESRAIDMLVRRLRAKLEAIEGAPRIETVRGVGFELTPD